MEEKDLRLIGKYFENGSEEVEGAMATTWKGLCAITEKELKKLLREREACNSFREVLDCFMLLFGDGGIIQWDSSGNPEIDKLESQVRYIMEMNYWLVQEKLRLEEEKQELEKKLLHPDGGYSRETIEARQKKARLRIAVVLALSIKGVPMDRINIVLARRKLSASTSVITKSLSVVKDGDKERLMSIILEFPDEFVDLNEADFESWFNARYEKTKRYKRFENDTTVERDKERTKEVEAVFRRVENQAAGSVQQKM